MDKVADLVADTRSEHSQPKRRSFRAVSQPNSICWFGSSRPTGLCGVASIACLAAATLLGFMGTLVPAAAAATMAGESVTGSPNLSGGVLPPTHATCNGSVVNIGYQVINQPAIGPAPGFVNEFGSISITGGAVTSWNVTGWHVSATPGGSSYEDGTMSLGLNSGTGSVTCSATGGSGTVSATVVYSVHGSIVDSGLATIAITFDTASRTGTFREQFLGDINTITGNPTVGLQDPANPGITPVTVSFTGVTVPGITAMTVTSSGPPAPPSFSLSNPPTYYNISTIAVVYATAAVCITNAAVTAGSVLLHFDSSGNATDVTAPGYPISTTICSVPLTSLSPFAVARRGSAPTITSAPNTTFTVGQAGSFTVTATGVPAPTLRESGSLPAGVTFNATSGVLSGTPGPATAGSYPLTFIASNGISPDASQSFTLTVAGSSVTATKFLVQADTQAVAGSAATFRVTAQDSAGNIATGYTGTIHVASTDGMATLPLDYTFLASEGGVHTFTAAAVFRRAGIQTLTVTDTTTPGLAGSSGPISVSPAAAAKFVLGTPAIAIPDQAFTFIVTAQDQFSNVATSYVGTVHFASSDSLATLPANYTFLASDQGTHSFVNGANLGSPGSQILTATDTLSAALTGNSPAINVGPLPPTATIITPPNGATYSVNQVVAAVYSCADGAGGPGIASCVGSVANNSPINTSTAGSHTFVVTATSLDGLSASATTSYNVNATGHIAPIDHLSWSPVPIARAGSLAGGQTVAVRVTALDRHNHVLPGVPVHLSLRLANPPLSDARAACAGSTGSITAAGQDCLTDAQGVVHVSYTSSTLPSHGGSDVLEAAVDSFGTKQVQDLYTYAAPVGAVVDHLVWSPSPVAAAGSLRPGTAVVLRVTAYDRDGSPIPGASIHLLLIRAPGSNAVASACGRTVTTSPPLASCVTDSTGGVQVHYTSATARLAGGSDALSASVSQAGPTVGALDLYTY